MKRIASFVAVVTAAALLCLSLAACGEKPADVDMYDLYKAMSGASDKWQEMKYVSSDDPDPATIFENVSKMDYSKVNAFFIYYAAKGEGNADEVVVIQVRQRVDQDEAAASLTAHLEKRKSLYATYDRSQLTRLEGARIVTKDGLAALIVADDADRVENAFYAYLSRK